jgi:hypothetical protein
MTFKFEISILGQQMRMDINTFEVICLPIIDEFHPIIFSFKSKSLMKFIHEK